MMKLKMLVRMMMKFILKDIFVVMEILIIPTLTTRILKIVTRMIVIAIMIMMVKDAQKVIYLMLTVIFLLIA
jgi:hypothetical protein